MVKEDIPQNISVKLDRNNVIKLTRPLIAECSDNIVTILKLVSSEIGEVDSKKLKELAVMPYIFSGREFESFETKKNRLISWILKKGFEDLMNAVLILSVIHI
jgi:hypothetical protein